MEWGWGACAAVRQTTELEHGEKHTHQEQRRLEASFTLTKPACMQL